ncbi:hypothetical protein E2C01_009014 [Portunus trituberculatus]|uniref:Uncharacterized protein n=1 Tax=Portunus trituberculatus TaxID=210409 RepID=A0A5B7D541_PORTR|nr:hypothetical protein [Portunus trituberculatus]
MPYRKPFGAGRLEAAAEVLLHLPRLGLIIYLDAFSDVIPGDRGQGGRAQEIGSRAGGGAGGREAAGVREREEKQSEEIEDERGKAEEKRSMRTKRKKA